MRVIKILFTILLCSVLMPLSQAQVLEKTISVEYKNYSIEEVLKDLSKKHKIQFSYSSTIIPVQKRISITVKNKNIRYVLNEIFKNTNISYQEVGSHIVLKKSEVKNSTKSNIHTKTSIAEPKTEVPSPTLEETPKETNINTQVISQNSLPENTITVADTTIYFPEINKEKITYIDTTQKDLLLKKYVSDKRALKEAYYKKLDSINLTEGNRSKSKSKLKNEFNAIMDELTFKVNELKNKQKLTANKKSNSIPTSKDTSINIVIDSLGNKTVDTVITNKNKTLSDSSQYSYKPIQGTIISPIGTNGIEGPNTINKISLNLLEGHSAGLEGIEFAGLMNREKTHVWGLQFAGLANIVGEDVRGGQFSGFTNINGGNTQGAQFAGFANLVSDNAFAVQGAGFMNIVTGNFKGTQLAGFSNVTLKETEGAQMAGFLNIAGNGMEGIQMAGFMNVASDTMQGIQIAGFLNATKIAKGSQIGIINIADTVSGVQLGMFSFSRRGYRRLEIFGSEVLQGNIAFKSSTSRLHNIYSAGVTIKDNDIYWSYGLGLGTEIAISKRFILNMDLICNHLHKNGYTYDELNLLNQFKLNAGLLLSKKTSLFAGPTFNVMVSDHYDTETNTFGAELTPKYAFYNETVDQINVSMWVGFNAGIRF